MNWSRIKTILILLFSVVNIVLVVNILITTNRATTVNVDTITNTVQILERNHISIQEALISSKMESMGITEVENALADKEVFIQRMLGEGYAQNENQYVLGNKTLLFTQSYFEYTDTDPQENLASQQQITDYTSDFLEAAGIRDAKKKIHFVSPSEDGKFFITYMQYIDDLPLFDSIIQVVADETGIQSMKGYWVQQSTQALVSGAKTPLRHITGILVDMINNPGISGEVQITGIETGYSIGNSRNDMSHRVLPAFPAYKVHLSTGEELVFDGISGKYIGK